MLAFERDKIVGAVRTDFVLSAEIIVISLGTVASAPFMQQVGVVGGGAVDDRRRVRFRRRHRQTR
jgi:predicted DNA repair protein MutK